MISVIILIYCFWNTPMMNSKIIYRDYNDTVASKSVQMFDQFVAPLSSNLSIEFHYSGNSTRLWSTWQSFESKFVLGFKSDVGCLQFFEVFTGEATTLLSGWCV